MGGGVGGGVLIAMVGFGVGAFVGGTVIATGDDDDPLHTSCVIPPTEPQLVVARL